VLDAFLTILNRLYLADRRLLLAVSGGLDSVVLAHLTQRAGRDFGIAHANFGLRGEESDGDEAFVQTLADRYGVPFFTKKMETAVFAKTEGLSIQVAARKLRYAWFNELLDAENFDFLATAHHRDDALETLLLNLTRGAGLAGLAAIPQQNGRVVRPLLSFSRETLETYARENALTWREDRSNASDDYPRNFVRHHVVPLLRELNPNLSETAGQSLDQLAAGRRLLEFHVAELRRTAWTLKGDVQRMDLRILRQHPEPLLLLHEFLRPLGFRYHQSAAIWAAKDGQAGKRFFSANYALTLDREALILLPRQPEDNTVFFLEKTTTELSTPHFTLRCNLRERDETPVSTNLSTATLDADLLQFPITLRRWQPGDWFCPMGMGGKRQKVSDLLVNLKIPRPLKSQIWVLESGGEIAWVVGLRVDERFRVREATGRVWEGEKMERLSPFDKFRVTNL